jgi:acetyl-CoA carboxylase beta subunit
LRIEGHVMVHRTDIAGGSLGQASPDRMCRALKWAPPRKQSFATISAAQRCRLTTAVPAVHALDLELPTL